MRILIVTACLVVITGCPSEKAPPPPPEPAKPAPTKPAEPPPAPPAAIADAGAPTEAATKPEWEPPLTDAESKALDTYAGFSGDGLVFAATQFSAGAGLPIMLFLSTTTNTVEKNVPIENGDTRVALAKELSEEGFPKPGTPPKIPPMVATKILPEGVVVTFSGMPATRPFKPFEGRSVPAGATVLALSKDGKHAAVRVVSKSAPTEFGPATELHTVTLFE